MIYKVGDMIKTKKQHACGGFNWIVMRVGVDIKLKCAKCEREIMLRKTELDKKLGK